MNPRSRKCAGAITFVVLAAWAVFGCSSGPKPEGAARSTATTGALQAADTNGALQVTSKGFPKLSVDLDLY